MTHSSGTVNPRIRIDGAIARETREYAEQKLDAALRHAPGAVLDARLTLFGDAASYRVDANVIVNGIPVHVHAVAASVQEAIDLMEDRLRARLRRLNRRPNQGPPTPQQRARDPWATVIGGLLLPPHGRG